jgi:4-hydroxybenzoate polyprenyltransferase
MIRLGSSTGERGIVSELLGASRPFSWINTALPFLAAALWLQHRITLPLVLGVLFFLFPYNLLLYGVNDLYDFESDRRNPRKGGIIEGGLIPPSHAARLWLAIALTTLPLIAAISWFDPAGGLALIGTSLVALCYSMPPLRAKEVPGLDALTAALAFVLPALSGAIIAGAALDRFPWLYLAAFLTWGIASQALGAIQDVPFDRQAHIRSIATQLGGRATAALATLGYLVAVALVAVPGGLSLLAAAALAPYALIAALCLLDDPFRWARRAWRGFLGLNLAAGFVITMVLLQTGAVSLIREVP